MSIPVKVPSAEDPALTAGIRLARWHFPANQGVVRGDLLVTLESKLLICEIEAEASGKLEILAPEGRLVEIGETIALLHTS